MNNGPVFIVGAPRSGTTLLQYMLRSHPTISLPTGESHFIVPLHKNANAYGDLSRPENIKRVLQAMEQQSAEFLYTDLHGLAFNTEKLVNELAIEGCREMRDIIANIFGKNAAGEGKRRWGDKTPYYVLHLPKILDWWPDAQIIHIIRDGRDVALSMLDRNDDFGIYNFYVAAEQWSNYVETGRRFSVEIPPSQYLELRYEDILNDQRTALRRICEFLGEIYSDDLLNFKKAGSAGKTPLLQKPVQKGNQQKWKSSMVQRQIRVFESVAAQTLRNIGYPVVTSERRLPLPLRALFRWHNAIRAWWQRQYGPRKPRWTAPT